MNFLSNSFSNYQIELVRKMCEKVKDTQFVEQWKRLLGIMLNGSLTDEELANYTSILERINEKLLLISKESSPIVGNINVQPNTLAVLLQEKDVCLESNSGSATAAKESQSVLRPKIPKLRIKVKEAQKSWQKKKDNKSKTKATNISKPIEVTLEISGNHLKETQQQLLTDGTPNANKSATPVSVEVDTGNKVKFEPGVSLSSELEDVADSSNKSLQRIISHLSYIIVDGNASFSCLLCQKNYHNSLKELLNHLGESHRTNRWFGNCLRCAKQYQPGNIFNELIHVIEDHLLKDRDLINNVVLISNTPSAKKNFDCFMTDLKERAEFYLRCQKNPPMISIPAASRVLESKSQIVKLQNQKMQMCPWIEEESERRIKNGLAFHYMSKKYLVSKFKCMDIECGYYTSLEKNFLSHLEKHKFQQKFTTHLCGYCAYSANDSEKLISHISKKHSIDKYQCNYCMYRSSGNHIRRHQTKYHMEFVSSTSRKLKVFVLLNQIKKPVENVESDESWNQKIVHVPMMTCMICKLKFYSFQNFLEHMNSYKVIPRTKCIRCSNWIQLKDIMKHLKSCHKFGTLQCCYCRFGTDNYSDILDHYMDRHQSEIPYYFKRNSNSILEKEKNEAADNHVVLLPIKEFLLSNMDSGKSMDMILPNKRLKLE